MSGALLVWVRGGRFEPQTIVAAAGEPLRLEVVREDASVCADRLLFPAFGIDAPLPLGRTISLELPAAAPGEYPFGCGYSTRRGRLIVQ
jgi:plastocyanin domain-containing protein